MRETRADAPSPTDPSSARMHSRRRFLRLGLGGTALLGVGGLLAYETSGYELDPNRAESLYAFSVKEYLIVRAIAARMLRPDEPPERGAPYPDPDELDVAARIDVFVARLEAPERRDLRRLLHVVEHVLPWSVGCGSRFTRLAGDDQDRVLAAMESSRLGVLRGGFVALKSLCAMAYFSDPLTWAPIGYDGPLVGRPAAGWVEAARLARRGAS